MKLIIPMAGMGKRMRPHTLTIPKPLIKIAGKPIVEHLIEEIDRSVDDKIEEIAFIIGDFGLETEEMLKNIARSHNAIPSIYYQEEALGTAHAIYCAHPSLNGKIVVAFADTLFKATIEMNDDIDGIIWAKEVEDPSQFGVVQINKENIITEFVEKPQTLISNLAIVGIYYFKKGEILREELKYLMDNDIRVGKEFQLTTALENMVNKKLNFVPGKVDVWMDCGNKNATVQTNKDMLKLFPPSKVRNAIIKNSIINEPCFIADGSTIENSIIGPYVSIGKKSIVKNAILRNSIIQDNSLIENENISDSMIGNSSSIIGKVNDYNIGDYCNLNLK